VGLGFYKDFWGGDLMECEELKLLKEPRNMRTKQRPQRKPIMEMPMKDS